MNSKEERFKKLIGEQEARIWSVCRHYAKDEADRKDLYQEILINTWKGFDNFRGEALPGTWMYRIAVNTSIGFTLKEKRRLQVAVTLGKNDLGYLTDVSTVSGQTPGENLLSEMESQVNQLSVIDKILVTLMLEDLSYREIADIVGITEPNVRVKIHRIKNLLRDNMKGESHEN
jgi:RNA polymerase sigma-70 factor, ECF subfamily